MDDIDIRLCQIMIQDSRTPYRELADEVGITVQAVHRRIQSLQESKVVSNLHANISLGYLNALNIVIVGRSECKQMDEAVKSLQESDSIHRLMPLAGHHLLVESFVRDISALESHIEFVKKNGQMGEMMMGIVGTAQYGSLPINQRPEDRFEMTPLDYSIVASLQSDSRKAVADIADELKVSAKTVKRRLDRMLEEKAVEFSMTYHPGFSGGAAAVIVLDFKPGMDKAAVRRAIIELIGLRLVYLTTFANLPDTVLAVCYGKTIIECNEMMDKLLSIEGVDKYKHHIIQYGYEFETWRDRLPRERAGSKTK